MFKRTLLVSLVVVSAIGVNLEQGKIMNFVPQSGAQSIPQTITIGDLGGGWGSPYLVTTAVNAAIVSKHLPYNQIPEVLVRSDGAWQNGAWMTAPLDIGTLNKTCEILGYSTYVSSTCYVNADGGRCNFKSPGDDTMTRWNPTLNNFVNEPANPKYEKAHIASITCKDPIIPAQCQDGLDNDGDGAIDMNDFSCSSATDTDETNPKSLCQDGIDNDGDGLTDYPNDLGCASKQDNDEYNAPTCTQSLPATRTFANGGLDAIGFVDQYTPDVWTYVDGTALADDAATTQKICQLAGYQTVSSYTNKGFSSCGDNFIAHWTGTTFVNHQACADGNHWLVNLTCSNPNQCAPTAQCADGLDNDGDGAIDMNDFSCSGPTDTDETNPKSQCQDGIDNDSDGLIDMNDPGCINKQDNTESNTTVDLKINGQDGTINVTQGQVVTLTWNSVNAVRCDTGTSNMPGWTQFTSLPTSGTKQVTMTQSGTFGIQCSETATSNMIAQDSVGAVIAAQAQCNDGIDNNINALIDAQDPVCHSDGNANNASSYDPSAQEVDANAPSIHACSSPVVPLYSLNDWDSVIVYEQTTNTPLGASQAYTFNRSDSRLVNQLSNFGPSNFDIHTTADEYYDIYISDQNGAANPNGSYVTARAYRNASYTNSATANNIDAIALHYPNGTVKYIDAISNVQLGTGLSFNWLITKGYVTRAIGTPDAYSPALGDGTSSVTGGFCEVTAVPPAVNGCNLQDPRITCLTQIAGVQPTFGTNPDGSRVVFYNVNKQDIQPFLNGIQSCGSGLETLRPGNFTSASIEQAMSPLTPFIGNTSRGAFVEGTCSQSKINEYRNAGITISQDTDCNNSGLAYNYTNGGNGTFLIGIGDKSSTGGWPALVCRPQTTTQCSDTVDNDADGLIDANDPGCHSDFNRYNSASYVASGNNEASNSSKGTCADGKDNDNDAQIDAQDSDCHSDGNAGNTNSFDPTRNEGGNTSGNADLSIVKTGPASATRGGTITYSITVSNAGPAAAQNVVITDVIPSGLTAANFLTATNCGLSGSQTTVTCALGTIASGSSQTVSIIFNVPTIQNCSQTSTFQNQASVTATNDSNTSNNTSTTVSSTINCGTSSAQCADGIDNDADNLIDANDPGCHTDFNRYNTASYNANGTNESANNGQGTCANGIDDNANGLIDAQDPACHTDGNPNNPGTFNPGGNEKSQCQDAIDNDADSLIDGNDPGCHTDFNRYNTASYNPNGNNEASNSNGYGTCADGKDNDNDAQIDAQDSDCHTDGNVNNNNSFNPSGNEGTTNTVNPTDLSITLTGPSTVTKGSTVTYIATVKNNGPAVATNIVVTDPPVGFTLVQSQSTQNCTQNGTVVTCTLASLAVGSSQSFSLVFSTTTSSCNASVTDIATVTASNTDPNTSNNQSQTVSTYVTCSTTGNQCQDYIDNDADGLTDGQDPDCHTDGNVNNSGSFDGTRSESSNNGTGSCSNGNNVQISIKDSPDPVAPDGEIEYEITLTNDCSTSQTVTVIANLDSDTEFVDATNGGDDIDDQTVRWTNLSIGHDNERTIRLTVRADKRLKDGDKVRLEVTTPTENETEDTRISTSGSSSGTTGLSVTTQADRSEAQPGDVVTYTLTVRNNGGTAITNATLQDNYTSGQLTILDPAGGQINGTSITWNFDRLEPNTSRQLRYTTRIGTGMKNGDIVANTVTLTGNGLTTSASGIVRIVTQLPQTGVGFGFLTGGSTNGLSPMQVSATTGNSSGGSTLASILAMMTTVAGGLGVGGIVGKKFLA